MTHSPIVLLHTDEPKPAEHIVRAAHPDLTIHCCSNYPDLASCLQHSRAEVVYTVRFAGTPDFPRQALLDSPFVQWISVGGSGTDHLQPWDATQLTVTNAAGVAADMMAEYVLGCVLSFRLNLRGFHQAQQQRQWIAGSLTPVGGQTALLIGMGPTGIAVSQRFKAMGMRVLGIRANPVAVASVDAMYGTDALAACLAEADIVVVAVPLLSSTRKLLSDAEFAAMKPNSILVDVSRGGVVDEAALTHALHNGQIEAAAVDVFNAEPLPDDHPLWAMDNVIITPHCASVYPGWAQRSVQMFASNLHRYRHRQRLDSLVNPDKGY